MLILSPAVQWKDYFLSLLVFLLVVMLSVIQSTQQNISARKKTEKQLRILNQHLQQQVEQKTSVLTNVFERITDAFVALDTNWHYTYMNEKAGQIFNCDPQKMIGRHIWTEFPEGLGQPFHRAYERAMKEQQYIYLEAYYPPYDRWFENHIYPSPDGLSIFFRDITEKKTTGMALKISEERYWALIEQASDAIMITDGKGTFLEVNTSFCTKFGYQKKELLGKNVSMVIDPEQYKKDPIQFDLLLEGQNIIRERRMIHKDGTIIEVEANVKRIPDGRILAIARDINERKKAEELLKKSEERYRALVENAPEALVVLDVEKRKFVSVSESAVNLFQMSKEELLLLGPEELSPEYQPDGRLSSEAIKENLLKTLSGEKPSFEWTHCDRSGRLIPCQVWLVRLPAEGQVLIRGSIIDITERKKAEEQILKEKFLSDSVINSLPGVFLLRFKEGGNIRWNKRLETISGYSAEEIAVMKQLAFFSDGEKPMIEEKLTQVFEKGSAEVETVITGKDGKKIPYYLTAQRIQYEGRPCLIVTGIDITDRKKAEEQLRESEQKYKLLFDSSPLPLLMFSRMDHSIIDVNEAAIKSYGYTREEFLHMNIKDLRPQEDKNRFMEEIKFYITDDAHLGIWRHRKKDGSVIFVEIIGHDIIYQGRPARLTLANDITEKLAYDEKLKQSYQEIRMLTKHLQHIREEERTHIAREIHDELGQQLTVLKMDVSWLNKKLAAAESSVKEKLKDLLNLLEGAVKSVRRISSELRPSLLDDLGLIAAIEWHLKEFEKRAGIKVKFYADEPELSLPEETRTGLFRIFQESLTNVARHANAKKVSVSLKRKGGEIVLSIEDDGNGFDKMKVADKKTLGILGMEERSSMMGGKYQINSIPGEGTIVEVSVPFELKTN
jgi:PAS domain S-box-containing protein